MSRAPAATTISSCQGRHPRVTSRCGAPWRHPTAPPRGPPGGPPTADARRAPHGGRAEPRRGPPTRAAPPDAAVFSFLYLKKIKILKIYVGFGKFQKYTPVALWGATGLKCNFFFFKFATKSLEKKKEGGLSPPPTGDRPLSPTPGATGPCRPLGGRQGPVFQPAQY